MRAFLERHVRAYRLAALFDADKLVQSIRYSFAVVLAVVPIGFALAVLIVWAFDRTADLLPFVVLGGLFGGFATVQIFRRRPNPTLLFVTLSAFIAVGAWIGDVEPIAGIVAGTAVASTASVTLTEGRGDGLRPLAFVALFLSVALFGSAPVPTTLLGIAVLVIAQAIVWWLIGTVSDEMRVLSGRFRALIDEEASGVVIVGGSGTVEFVNRAGQVLVGDVTGEAPTAVFGDVVLGETHAPAEARGRDGTAIPVLVRQSEFSVGSTVFRILTFEDQRPRLKEQAKLAASESRHNDLFDSVPVGLYTTSVDGSILRGNEAILGIVGFDSLDEFLGVSAFDLYVDPSRRSVLQDQLSSGESVTAEYQLRRKDGSIIWVRDHSSVQMDVDGMPLHYHGELTDITLELSANEALRRTMQQREQLIAAVSHELRTPLTSVLGLAHLLVDGELDGGEVAEVHGVLLGQAQDLAYIVEDLLAASQLSQGGLRVAPRTVDLGEVVSEAVESVGLDDHDVHVVYPTDVLATGDPTRIRQVVRNLLTNVAKYGGHNVVIELGGSDEVRTVMVADDGEGLGGQAEEAFEAFHRLRPGTTDHGSLGLGLTLARGLADAMNGSLTYSHEDGWARFTLALPSAVQARSMLAGR